MDTQFKKQSAFRSEIYRRAVVDSFRKLNPLRMVRNPVMFVVEVGSVLTTGLWVQALLGSGEAPTGFIAAVAVWLWFTVLFANFSEAVAEGRGKAQAQALRKARQDTPAKRLQGAARSVEEALSKTQIVYSTPLKKGYLCLVGAGVLLQADGDLAVGIASEDESAVTREPAPV